jgi:ketosteroid isomerase-like protein
MDCEQLKQLDIKFCEDCKEGGANAWISYFHDDAIMVTNGDNPNIIGKENIFHAVDKLFSLQDLIFTWEPTFCELSDDQTMGVTMGNYIRKYKISDSFIEEKGKYTTVWKYKNGEWLISMDIGN